MQKIKVNLTTLTLLLPTAVLMTGCGLLKNLSEMHDSTAAMSGTTANLAQTTAGMAKTTDGMAISTAQMNQKMDVTNSTTADAVRLTEDVKKTAEATYADLRVGNARQARQDALAAIAGSEEMPSKMGYASEYFAAMEYQFWKPQLEDADQRQEMMRTAVKDFFIKVQEYISDRNSFSAEGQDPKTENLYALAAMLHYESPSQIDALKGTDGTPVTMLSMIEDGLRAKDSLEKGDATVDSLPPYQLEVLRKEQDAVYLLRVRQNFLKAFGFVLSASFESGNEPTKWNILWQFLKTKITGSWTPNFAVRNSAQVDYNAIVLEYAADTVHFLTAQGYDPKTVGPFQAFLKKMNVDKIDPGPDKAKADALAHMKKALASVVVDDVAGN